MINFWTYKKEYKKYKHTILNSIDRALNTGNIFFGNELTKFEKNFARKYKAKYSVAVKSCTDAFSSLIWLTIFQISIKVFMKEIENCISPQMIKMY